MARALRADPDLFRRLALEHPLVLQLRERTRTSNELVRQATRYGNQIGQQLWRYFPQLLQIPRLGNPATLPWFLKLWEKAKTPQEAGRLTLRTLRNLLKKHGIRRLTATALRDVLQTPALVVAPGTAEAAIRALTTLCAQARVTKQLLAQAQRDLRELLQAFSQAHATEERPDDLTILLSLPGVGLQVASTLLAEAYDLIRRRDYRALRLRSGVAPVSVQSGKTEWVIRRLAVQHELREAIYHWARVAAVHDPLSKARYRALRARGHSHGRALRTVGDRLLAVACAMFRNGTLYDPNLSRVESRRLTSTHPGNLKVRQWEVSETPPSSPRPAKNRRPGAASSKSRGNRSPSTYSPLAGRYSRPDFPGTPLSTGFPGRPRPPPSTP